ncbi:hypothetical protein BKA69DRAFT_1035011 [Paraphysoderma sedebokerense]|nr:hypothetical protein BKA69DRAFT_1035011 [Paraphysoderma sedebokerense]
MPRKKYSRRALNFNKKSSHSSSDTLSTTLTKKPRKNPTPFRSPPSLQSLASLANNVSDQNGIMFTFDTSPSQFTVKVLSAPKEFAFGVIPSKPSVQKMTFNDTPPSASSLSSSKPSPIITKSSPQLPSNTAPTSPNTTPSTSSPSSPTTGSFTS